MDVHVHLEKSEAQDGFSSNQCLPFFSASPEFKNRNSCGENPENFRVFQGDLRYITKMKLCESVSEITYIALLRDLCIYIYIYIYT